MELTDLIFLGACSILSEDPDERTDIAIEQAVRDARIVWKEVLTQDRER